MATQGREELVMSALAVAQTPRVDHLCIVAAAGGATVGRLAKPEWQVQAAAVIGLCKLYRLQPAFTGRSGVDLF